MTEDSQNEGYASSRQTKTFGQATSMSGLLQQVQAAPTVAGGLTTLRTGIAGILANGLGPTITQEGYDPDGGGTGNAIGTPTDMNIPQLAELYQSLLIDNDEWADALIANTPLAEDTGQEGATQSRSAFA